MKLFCRLLASFLLLSRLQGVTSQAVPEYLWQESYNKTRGVLHALYSPLDDTVFVLTSLTQDAEDGLSREGANILYVDPATGVVRKRWVTPPNADNVSGSGEGELVGFYGSSGYEYLIVKVSDLFNGTSSGRYIAYDTGTESERWTFLILPPERGGPAFDNSIPAIIQTVRLCTLDNREETYPRLML
jgi:hypothetical protein